MGKRIKFFLFIAMMSALAAISAAQDKTGWQLDAAHSNVGFSVSHLVISDVEGEFTEFSGDIQFNPEDISKSKANITIQVSSIDTDNADRDGHLRSNDFFNAEEYPTITFVSKNIKRTGDDSFEMTGDLTIRGKTKEVTLTGTHSQVITDPWGNERIGFKLNGTINRQDFGVEWNKTLDSGGLVVGNEVDLEIDGELMKPGEKG